MAEHAPGTSWQHDQQHDLAQPPSSEPPAPGWWLASDGRWYPPELHPDYRPPAVATPQAVAPTNAQADWAAEPTPSAAAPAWQTEPPTAATALVVNPSAAPTSPRQSSSAVDTTAPPSPRRRARKVALSTWEGIWYVVMCVALGAAYFAKIPAKKAMQDFGYCRMTSAEQFWYVVMCVPLGAGYFAKIPVAKALAELPQNQPRVPGTA